MVLVYYSLAVNDWQGLKKEVRIKNQNELLFGGQLWVLKGDRYHIWSNHCILCGFVYVCLEFWGTVRLCKQAASYFLAPVPLETLEAL